MGTASAIFCNYWPPKEAERTKTMQPTLSTSPSGSASFAKRWFWHREVRIFLIHYGIWLAVSLISAWLGYTYMTADAIKQLSPTMAKYQNDWGEYVKISLVGDFIYLLPVHLSYWLYTVSFRKGQTWRIVLFILYFLLYLLILSILTGFYVAYFGLPDEGNELMSMVFVMWAYTLIFITIRAYQQNRRRQRDLESQKMKAELQALKAQVNPHFMFNTLNNLYGTALTGDSNRTAAGIEQLSSVMRHVTVASHLDLIPIEQELRFVDDLVELHRLRVPRTDTFRIETRTDWDEKPAQIIPLLLNPLIENAFKYGISTQHPCFVIINLKVQDSKLQLTIENSVLARTDLEKGTGLGLANVRQRLKLAYPSRHELTVEEKDNVFLVDLTIKL